MQADAFLVALKYHPDRNPGKESEVQHKFQIIQSAHEILTNVETKARYDNNRTRTTTARYPTASGKTGNPWKDAGSAWAPPPTRRPANPSRPSATASRYASWATPPQTSGADPSDHAKAWDRMRPGAGARPPGPNPAGTSAYQANSRKTAKPTAPPVPPRTEAQRKKAEASFGNSTKRTNFSQPVPDEPPAASNNYSFTARKPANVFAEAAAHAYQQAQQQRPVPPRPDAAPQTQQTRPVPPRPIPDPIDPLSQQFQDTFMDGRQRTPYSAHGGEKFNPFDGATNLGRGKSMRDSPRTGQTPASSQPPSPGQRHRSASVPDEKDNNNQASNTSSSRAGSRYTPGTPTQFSGTGAADASNNGHQGQCSRFQIVQQPCANKDDQQGRGIILRLRAPTALMCMATFLIIILVLLPSSRLHKCTKCILHVLPNVNTWTSLAGSTIPHQKQAKSRNHLKRCSNGNYSSFLRRSGSCPSFELNRQMIHTTQQRRTPLLTLSHQLAFLSPPTTIRLPRPISSALLEKVLTASTLGL